MWGKRKTPPVPGRHPHPDARVEAELQRILALQRAVGRQEQLIEQNLDEIRALRVRARTTGYRTDGREFEKLARGLVAENAEVEAAIGDLHNQIDERVTKLTETDLAYL